MSVAKVTTPYQISEHLNLVTERVSIKFVRFEMSTAIGVGERFTVRVMWRSRRACQMWKTRRIMLTLAKVSAQQSAAIGAVCVCVCVCVCFFA